jgi:hypothetical protein
MPRPAGWVAHPAALADLDQLLERAGLALLIALFASLSFHFHKLTLYGRDGAPFRGELMPAF